MVKRLSAHLRPEAPTPVNCRALQDIKDDVSAVAARLSITAAPSFERGRPVDYRWVEIMRLLDDQRSVSVQSVADALGIPPDQLQPVFMKMCRRGLLQTVISATSAEQARVALTGHGKIEAERLIPLFDEIDSLTSYLLAIHAPHLVSELKALIAALGAEPFDDQLTERLKLSRVVKP
ncbi:MAG: hypothetical protein AAFQ21_02970 [Pseudomonadota bacterium]